MLFASYSFLLFAIVFFSIYRLLPRSKQNYFLLAASYFFYGVWDVRFLALILASTTVDYFVGKAIEDETDAAKRKRLVTISLAFNLGALAFFKYFNFFVGSAEDLLRVFGLADWRWSLKIVLPVGISFYTFQTIGYIIDVYRGKQKAERNFFDYALFVSFFPQILAGPIQRAKSLLPQIKSRGAVTSKMVYEGLWLISFGLFKKVVVADNLAIIANEAFTADSPQGLMCLLGVYAFTFQIYCDFAGYSDMARGLGKLMGIEMSVNFDRPYIVTNPRDFWRRWHISLSTWLRDYLYISLGGNQTNKWRVYLNLMITMVLGGLWHGAAWTFVAWGAFHGALLCAHRYIYLENPGRKSVLPGWLRTILFFQLVAFGWLIFKADSLAQVGMFVTSIFTPVKFDMVVLNAIVYLIVFATPLFVIEKWINNADDPRAWRYWSKGLGPVIAAGMWLAVFLLSPNDTAQFIYFKF